MGIKDYPHEQVRAEKKITECLLITLGTARAGLKTTDAIFEQAQKELEELRKNDNNKTTKEH